jgi:hypothetical protein
VHVLSRSDCGSLSRRDCSTEPGVLTPGTRPHEPPCKGGRDRLPNFVRSISGCVTPIRPPPLERVFLTGIPGVKTPGPVLKSLRDISDFLYIDTHENVSRLFHFVREHRLFNGRKHFINVLTSHDHDRYKNLFFYLFTLQMLRESFSGANPH